MKRLTFILLAGVFMTLFLGQSVFSGENLRYKKKLIKSRAERGYNNNGTVIYSYKEIDAYSDDLDDEALGNISVDRKTNPRVREVHNWVEVKGDVTSRKKELSIGEVTLENRYNVREVDNRIIVDGDVHVKKPDELNIGNVKVERRARANTIQSTVGIHGEVNTD